MKKQLTLISALSLLVLTGVSKDLLIHLKSGEELTFTTDKVDQVRFSGSIGDAEMPEDPYPSATDFSHKVLLMDHTGTDCGNCPIVTSAFRQLEADDAYSSSYTLAALHSSAGDPMGNAMIRAVSGAYMNRPRRNGVGRSVTWNWSSRNRSGDTANRRRMRRWFRNWSMCWCSNFPGRCRTPCRRRMCRRQPWWWRARIHRRT